MGDLKVTHKGMNFEIEGDRILYLADRKAAAYKNDDGEWRAINSDQLLTIVGYAEIEQVDAQAKLLKLIADDTAAGNFDRIVEIHVGMFFAQWLWLQGILRPEHFEKAVEDTESILLPNVAIGPFTFPVRIVGDPGRYHATIDKDGKIV